MSTDLEKLSASVKRIKDGAIQLLLSAGYVTGVVLLVIGLTFMIIEIGEFYKVSTIKNWPVLKNAGTVVDSYLETKQESGSYINIILANYTPVTFYRPRFSFTYRINDVDYISYDYSYHEPWEVNPMIPKYDINYFKKGSHVDIIVNPNNPAEAYMVNKPYNSADPIAIGTMIALVGLLIMTRSS